ncbi:long-chain fatty acid--CoA ligase [Leptospira gomenensis]|uniref:Long-chain fatty acid--CoA ligase n=1 Tax=Leptospira gomenensis TaxID=2484974 RepID=A0A5F1Y576_9LEPT|nr:long-chain fatty acid--CoA ligase [Leptospira gomenensis]TGK27562.1 long-chain fatty acid--CoA ligase [Leptospira gomenensis]TGK38226.1 long-chain fatty acid--CoA ligase [Leptospira gomenensis]TGK42643.1 long-chain fatty acid--CoA ligase [Leptospira gomenensis]TGK65806.1 long-chain fatty acid--CoA ligase [Leptospira gomenensis]
MKSSRIPSIPSQTLYHVLKASAETFADSTAQYYKPDGKTYQPFSFKKLNETVQQIGSGLISLGLEPGTPVGLIADSGARWIWCSMAITNIGCVDVPRGTDSTEEDLLYILNHAECSIAFLENENALKKILNRKSEYPHLKKVVLFDRKGDAEADGPFEILLLNDLIQKGKEWIRSKGADEFHKRGSAIREEDLATIVYTSGTTGRPKGVMLTHKNIVFNVDSALKGNDLNIYPSDRSMAYLPPWHIAERLVETVCLRAGGAEAFTSISTLSQDLAEIKPTLLLSVPRVWESLYNKIHDKVKTASPLQQTLFQLFKEIAVAYYKHLSRLQGLEYSFENKSVFAALWQKFISAWVVILLWLPNQIAQLAFNKIKQGLGGELRFALSGAGALPQYIDTFFNAIGIPILEGYGMTELSGISTRRILGEITVGTLGRCIPGVQIKLTDEKGNEITKPGVKGIAWHKGDHVMKGYYKEPEKTKEILSSDGWLNSGDLLTWTVSGELKYSGRAKDTIVLLGGENLEPEPIEFALVRSEFIHQVMVVGHDQKTLGALIVPNEEALEKYLKELRSKMLNEVKNLNSDPDVLSLFKNEIKSLVSNETGFKNFEKVSNFRILDKKFEPGDELTQTMKIKRNVVADKYKKEIEDMYR